MACSKVQKSLMDGDGRMTSHPREHGDKTRGSFYVIASRESVRLASSTDRFTAQLERTNNI